MVCLDAAQVRYLVTYNGGAYGARRRKVALPYVPVHYARRKPSVKGEVDKKSRKRCLARVRVTNEHDSQRASALCSCAAGERKYPASHALPH